MILKVNLPRYVLLKKNSLTIFSKNTLIKSDLRIGWEQMFIDLLLCATHCVKLLCNPTLWRVHVITSTS